MRCPTCAAFVDDAATSCTSCGAEVAVAPPPLPPELAAAPPAEAPPPGRRPDSPSDPGATRVCDGCGNPFPSMELQRVHSQRLCATCADRADTTPARPSSGRTAKAPTAAATVSRAPLVLMGAAVVVLASVAVYFTVLAPGAGGEAAPPANPGPGPGPIEGAPPLSTPPAIVPTLPAIRQATDLTFEGTLQPWEPDPENRGNPRYLAFVDTLAGRELRVSNIDKHLAGDYTVGKRYRVSFRDVPSDDKLVQIRFSLKSTRIDATR